MNGPASRSELDLLCAAIREYAARHLVIYEPVYCPCSCGRVLARRRVLRAEARQSRPEDVGDWDALRVPPAEQLYYLAGSRSHDE